MWHALRTEIDYFRPWLLGGLGIAAGIIVLLAVLIRFFEDGDGPPGFVVTIFPAIAGMVVSFIAQGTRSEERRARLLLAGSLRPRDLAWVTVLLPVCFMAIAALAGVPLVALAFVITSKFEPVALAMATGFGIQFLAYAQLGPLAQESTAARRQRRGRASLAGWLIFGLGVLALTVAQFGEFVGAARLSSTAVVVVSMIAAAILYQGRTDFTR
jgi:hypothetical protein